MRLNLFLGTTLSLVALVFSSQVVLEQKAPAETPAPADPVEPVVVTAAFPQSNTFGHIFNGEKNTITLTVENRSGKSATLVSVGGAVYNVQTEALIKNLTALKFSRALKQGIKLQVPYTFYSEFKPGDIRLNVWLDHTLDNQTVRVGAYDSIVTIVEPEVSIFDFKMVSTYLVTLALLTGLGYVAYQTFAPKRPRTKKRTAPAAVSAPVGAVTATGAGGYQEEWIPEHHMRKPKVARKKSGGGALTSGDEFSEMSAGEMSAPEKEKKAKGKGRK
ncbi:hypothetical protein B0H15DRAFT_843499 [Mycena belliarum]|uniref:Translocon-associated protein subunit alpha n=1 Tax=Mycena belliarum TaxID=1033014 RepID=A0AAD6U7I3_9AGAR|nr:hypothetical protein B0H15DRAFT_843499 [Mycena belliae]